MPTPVSVARQCLTEEAARALDDAVAVARRRSHAQTTSLHAVSALLALPTSALREACARSRSTAYAPPRLQFRALELSVGVSLDRLPSSKSMEEPPVSNSLMAAIKRSQANQRRHPESFHLQQIHGGNAQAPSVLKVELKHLILSILDDPIVSRVFGEAGFRSADIKMALIHPPVTHSPSRLAGPRCPPIFLCNLTDSALPFPAADHNSRRICEILLRNTRRNPLLVGVCSRDALNSFNQSLHGGKPDGLAPELAGLLVIPIEDELADFVAAAGGGRDALSLKLAEVDRAVERCSGPGVLLNFGDLKVLAGDADADGATPEAAGFVVAQVTAMLERNGGKLWVMGVAESYETYSKFLLRFPNVDKDWDLHLLPITSSKPSTSAEGLASKSSLMGSFIPFAGFFSSPSDFQYSSQPTQPVLRCHLCNEKYEQEVAGLQASCSSASTSEQYTSNLSSWLQVSETMTRKNDEAMTKADATTLYAKILGLQRKWNDNCQRVHHAQQLTQLNSLSMVGFAANEESSRKNSYSRDLFESADMAIGMQRTKENISKSPSAGQDVNFQTKVLVRPALIQQEKLPFPTYPTGVKSANMVEKNKIERHYFPPNPSGNRIPSPQPSSSSNVHESVATDLRLGTFCTSSEEPNTHDEFQHLSKSASSECGIIGKSTSNTMFQDLSKSVSSECGVIAKNTSNTMFQNLSKSISSECGVVAKSISNMMFQSSLYSLSNLEEKIDRLDFKALNTALFEKVGWQDEAICVISKSISLSKSRNKMRSDSTSKGDIWLAFIGPDKVGKKKIASALAEVIFGHKDSLISVDFSYQGQFEVNSIFECQELVDYDLKFRGKTVIDFITEELSRKPHSIVLFENVDKADLMAQASLSQAINTGKFLDSHRRETSVKNMIFLTTSKATRDDSYLSMGKKSPYFSEEEILRAKSYEMQLVGGRISQGDYVRNACGVGSIYGMNVRVASRDKTSHSSFTNKRKFTDGSKVDDSPKQKQAHKESFLDLNVPVLEIEEETSRGSDSDSVSDNTKTWLEDFLDQVDEKVHFKPFDFDALAEEILAKIGQQIEITFGSNIMLEIDYQIMIQMLAATWLSDKTVVEKWVRDVLGVSFVQAREKYHLTTHNILKLVPCEGIPTKNLASRICLPARIILK